MSLENRYACSPNEVKTFDTDQLRKNFLVSDIMVAGQIKGVYSHYDRMITLGAIPMSEGIVLPNFHDFTKKDNFLDRREIESYRSVHNLIKDAVRSKSSRPLSIAVLISFLAVPRTT